jgi:hypothetical protein
MTQAFLNRGHVLARMSRSPSKDVARGRLTNNRGNRSGQLLIGELAQEVQEFLPRCQELRCQHLQRVVMVRVHDGLIDVGDG